MIKGLPHPGRGDDAFRVVVCCVLLFAAARELPAAEVENADLASGESIYLNLCAGCHGAKGEGVAGRYEAALGGQRSLGKVTSLIANTMPENDPDRCVGVEAAAVAQYVYSRFYATRQEAVPQARVELVRLTNRQYRQTVADLLQHFAGSNANLTEERGLRATYYNSRNFKRDTRVEQRVDPVIDFDYGTNSPSPETIGAEEFSVQWQGSVLAPETGEYEFTVRTPNGVRLWINDPENALIDASVASGDVHEHSARLPLLGGRAYPLRLQVFKSKDKAASIALHWRPPEGVTSLLPTRCLSPQDTRPVCVVATPFPPDDSSVGYERGVAISKAWDEAATQAAIEVAQLVVDRLDRLAGTSAEAEDRPQRVRRFCEEFVERAFRRPLSAELRHLYLEPPFAGNPPLEVAVKRVVLLALKSPRFLYLGLDANRADDYSVASRLSYALWDSLPDQRLWKQAAAGALRSERELRRQAYRLIQDARAKTKMRDFLHYWLQLHHVEDLTKDQELFPDFSPEIIADLRTSLDLFLENIVWDDSADYRQLLLADHLWLNGRLARFYGFHHEAGEEFVPVSVDPAQRSGVLTHPYLLAAFAYPRSSSPIHRGVFLTRNIMGRPLNPPPLAIAFKDAEFDPKLTMREKVAELTRPEACQSCHATINPLGFSLEHFDAVGRYRTVEGDRLIEAASDYTSDAGETIHLTGARDVARHAVASPSAQLAFVEQLFHHVVKQPAAAYGPNTLDRLQAQFAQDTYNIQNLLVEIALTAATAGPDPNPTSQAPNPL